MGRYCEDHERYLSGTFEVLMATKAYASGRRGSDILDILANTKALSDNLGRSVPIPTGYDRTTWEDVLSDLVKTRLGDTRCLNCFLYYRSPGVGANGAMLIGGTPSQRTIHVPSCPNCGGIVSEPIGCTIGVV